jgi:hypothetical protein
MSFQIEERKKAFIFHWQTFFNSISDEREREKMIHAELRNLRIDHQLVQSYSYTFDHLFAVLLFTVRDKKYSFKRVWQKHDDPFIH